MDVRTAANDVADKMIEIASMTRAIGRLKAQMEMAEIAARAAAAGKNAQEREDNTVLILAGDPEHQDLKNRLERDVYGRACLEADLACAKYIAQATVRLVGADREEA